ncbi:hypothetical protein NQ317_010021 [Molorchus minor]|uniref:Uncharacterized protein n=1 Tax=Molorchus minor TaxID=1323400 RepID=A0ABQ9JB13_9CUCU|nr:hypothetical protein NQ317_010021 [Molorchus minor]
MKHTSKDVEMCMKNWRHAPERSFISRKTMDEDKSEFVDKTILNTPKPTACSTVDRSLQRKKERSYILENSLGLLPSNSLEQVNSANNISFQLQQQRLLANTSLQRSNKVTGIPSRYLKPNTNISLLSNRDCANESTISECDLLKTPKDTSTPRSSTVLNNSEDDPAQLSLGKSMAALSYKIGNTDISIDNFVKEFQKAMEYIDSDKEADREIDSAMFKPAEEAASMLLADELSWRRQNELPLEEPLFSTEDGRLFTPSSSSTRSSSSLTSLPNGKLPIDSNREKLFGDDFILGNKTSKRLSLQMSILGHEFKIRKDSRPEGETLSVSKFILHPHESKPIFISYIPTKIGAAADEIVFTSLDPNLQQTKKQCIRLFGYGGYGKIDLYNLTKDTTGKYWQSLGKLDNWNNITKSFLLKNNGTLPSFAYITYNQKELFTFANITVTPQFLVLNANEQKDVRVTYIPTSEDHKAAHQSFFTNGMVADIGTLIVVSGTEVNRGRFRRLHETCIDKSLTVDPLNEVMPPDLIKCKESVNSLKDIFKFFTRCEIILTLEQDPEQTLIPHYPDDSVMFQSLCQDTTASEKTRTEPLCKLEPASIILMPPTKVNDSLFLISECNKVLNFEVVCDPEGLEISPKDGTINPGQEMIIDLVCPGLSKS